MIKYRFGNEIEIMQLILHRGNIWENIIRKIERLFFSENIDALILRNLFTFQKNWGYYALNQIIG